MLQLFVQTQMRIAVENAPKGAITLIFSVPQTNQVNTIIYVIFVLLLI